MPESKEKVIHVIKDYVNKVGGSVPLEFLLQDYETAYVDPLPFTLFGYSTVEDFLCDIKGISLYYNEDDTLCIQYTGPPYFDDSQAGELDDLTQLSVRMKNTLLLDAHPSSRVVTIQSREAPSRTSSEEAGWHAASGRPSLQFGSGPPTDSDYYSTYDSAQDNLSSSCGASYSSFENVQSLTLQPRPETHNYLQFQRENSNPQYLIISSDEPCLSTGGSLRESNNTPRPVASVFSKPLENPYSSTAHRTEDIFRPSEETRDSIHSTLDVYPSSIMRPLKPLIPPSESTYVRSLYQSCPPQDICVTNTFPPNLPTLINIPTLRPTLMVTAPVFPANSFASTLPPNTLPMLRPHHQVSEGAFSPSLPNNWPGNLRQFTEDDLIGRIRNLVNSQKQLGGVDSSTIERKYRDMYATPLPEQWLALLEERGALYVEKLARDTIVYPTRFFPIPPTLASLPPLLYPSPNLMWNVHVSQYVSISHVWFRLKDEDFDRKYETLQRGMNRHYPSVLDSIKCLVQVSAGQLCAVNFRNEWFRGEVLESDPGAGWVKCLLFDEGITQNFPSEKVYPLDEKFTNTPSLTFQGQLHSLEKWEKCNYINCEVRLHFLDQPDVTVKVLKFLSRNQVSVQAHIEMDSKKVVLNAWIAEFARVQLEKPILYASQTYEIVISSAGRGATVQVQVSSTCLRVLADALQKVSDAMKDRTNRERYRVRSLNDLNLVHTIYLARCSDDSWKRIVCLRTFPKEKVAAVFIDLGEEKTVHLRDIFETAVVSDIINFIDPQAVLVQLSEIDAVYLESVELARNHFSRDVSFAMEVLRLGSIPFVKLLGKVQRSGEFVPMQDLFRILKQSWDNLHPPP